MEAIILPALQQFAPDLLIISAGFDAHRNDLLGGLALSEPDFAWVTLKLLEQADKSCGGRVVSVLEGGYDLAALASSTAVHVQALMRGTDASK
jgi:acetoin utilization deacetylase AcuC-like enzyme